MHVLCCIYVVTMSTSMYVWNEERLLALTWSSCNVHSAVYRSWFKWICDLDLGSWILGLTTQKHMQYYFLIVELPIPGKHWLFKCEFKIWSFFKSKVGIESCVIITQVSAFCLEPNFVQLWRITTRLRWPLDDLTFGCESWDRCTSIQIHANSTKFSCTNKTVIKTLGKLFFRIIRWHGVFIFRL